MWICRNFGFFGVFLGSGFGGDGGFFGLSFGGGGAWGCQNYDQSACHIADFIIPVLDSFYKSEPQFPSLINFLRAARNILESNCVCCFVTEQEQ